MRTGRSGPLRDCGMVRVCILKVAIFETSCALSGEIGASEGPGLLGRLKWTDELGQALYIQLQNGNYIWLALPEPTELFEGDTVLVGEKRVDKAPEELWPDERWVTVVRSKLEELTIIDTNGQLSFIPTNE